MESLRVDATLLGQSTSKTVRIIGKLNSIDSGSSGTINSNGTINITSATDMNNLTVDNWYEILGKVQKDLSVNVLEFFDFGKDINENAVKKLVEVVHRVPELYSSE